MNRWWVIIACCFYFAIATAPTAALEAETPMTLYDSHGQILLQTGMGIAVGDMFINEDNQLYEVTHVEGTKAIGVQRMQALSQPEQVPVLGSLAAQQPTIAIYHTHSDESYIPSDGVANAPGRGSIYLVGSAMGDRLKELGYQIQHDWSIHNPHDANAYQRSRRTFLRLLKTRPLTILDVHRDSAPYEAYRVHINRKEAARVMLVVGRQNQTMSTTLHYARQLKAATDERYRGLVRGIFIAHGNYNQDLSPRALLVEIGSENTPLPAAQYSAALFADSLPAVLRPAKAPTTAPDAASDGQTTPESPKTLGVMDEAPDAASSAEQAAIRQDMRRWLLIGGMFLLFCLWLRSRGSLTALRRLFECWCRKKRP